MFKIADSFNSALCETCATESNVSFMLFFSFFLVRKIGGPWTGTTPVVHGPGSMFCIHPCIGKCNKQYYSVLSSITKCYKQYYSVLSSITKCYKQYYSVLSSITKCHKQCYSVLNSMCTCKYLKQFSTKVTCTICSPLKTCLGDNVF